ncbi:MAG: nitroreductase [Aquabacterium commune]|uniref:nitroreductase family protein n=1 Tax=Aquabacterium commune TaxID=70586 RepID=UPI003BAE7704
MSIAEITSCTSGLPLHACGAPAAGYQADEAAILALEFLAQRYSVGPKYLTEPAPDLTALRKAVAVALRAPDHRSLRPFRFCVVPTSARPRLAELFAGNAARRGHGADEVERARERAWNGPALIALIGRVGPNSQDVPESEQWVCLGAGLMNFLNALHLQGFGAKVLSGESVRDEFVRAAFCTAGETLVAWIVAGTPSKRSAPKAEDDVDGAIAVWQFEPALRA